MHTNIFDKVIKDNFPLSAKITWKYEKQERLSYRVQWKLTGNKPSKIIFILIHHDILEDCDVKKNEVQQAFQKYITEKLKQFDPEHDAPEGTLPPSEEWIVMPSDVGL